MKTAEEWVDVHDAEQCMTQSQLEILFRRIQSDAFHAGELKGLQDAKDIISNRFQEKIHWASLGAE